MRVSMGVLPTKRTKNSCSMTEEDTVRSEGSRRSSLPKRLGWLGYWLLTYSSRAHCDFSCRLSMWAASDRPQASAGAATGRRDKGRGAHGYGSEQQRHKQQAINIFSRRKGRKIEGKRKGIHPSMAPHSFFTIPFPQHPIQIK